MTAPEFVNAATALMEASPINLNTVTRRWWTLGDPSEWTLAVHVPAQFVGALEKAWNALRRKAAQDGLTIKMDIEVTLTESAAWGMASGVPLTESNSFTKGQLTISPLVGAQEEAKAA